MTPDQIIQLRQNAFMIRSIADNDEPKQTGGEPEACFPKIRRLADQILTLLPCQTCNGTRKVGTGIGEDGRDFDMRSPEILEPCPDCK